jgi:hypothetical protein
VHGPLAGPYSLFHYVLAQEWGGETRDQEKFMHKKFQYSKEGGE